MQVEVLNEQEDHGAGVSTLVMNEGQYRSVNVVVESVRVSSVMIVLTNVVT